MTVTLKPDLEEELAARAQAEGLTTEEFVNRVLERLVAQEKPAAELAPKNVRGSFWNGQRITPLVDRRSPTMR
jgi:hypothetical protein